MKKMLKILSAAGLFVAAAALFTSCGSLRSPKELKKKAEKEYGKCTLLSSSESEKVNVVTLKDDLQGFEYEYKSYYADFGMDGQHFFSVPSTGSDFDRKLYQYCMDSIGGEFRYLCDSLGVEYESLPVDPDSKIIVRLYGSDEDSLKEAAVGCAGLLQGYNVNNRLDGVSIYARIKDGDHIGSARLPDCEWYTEDDEKNEYYSQCARNIVDPKAKFLYAKEGTFADTGLSLDKVSKTADGNYPKTMNDKVVFYYFDVEGEKQFYLCDFLVNDSKYGYIQYYSYTTNS